MAIANLGSNYTIGEPLGAGGMGCVVAAVAENGEALAIKRLLPALADNEVLRRRLIEEAALARRVSHPNVLRVLDTGTGSDNTPFFVMQRAPGRPLGVAVRDHGPLSLRRIRSIASQILAGAAAIHAAGLVHGDLKSDNILVDDRDHITIIDFGLARPQWTRPTWLGEDMLSGTPEYMAPEVIRGLPMTPLADLYAVGVILYEMLTGTTPFGGGDTTTVLRRHLEDDVVPPSLRCTERTIPAALEAVIMCALAKEPSGRHASAGVLESAIAHAIPPSLLDEPVPGTCSFSTTASTRPCVAPPRRRLAEGTRGKSLLIQRLRKTIHRCRTADHADAAIEAYLDLTNALLDDHQLHAASDELAAAVSWLGAMSPVPARMWCLLVTLAALQDGLHDRPHARQLATAAVAAASAAADRTGIEAASRLLTRLARDRRGE